MAEKTRIYKVTEPTGAVRLVRASHPTAALRFVADRQYKVEVASDYDLEAAIKQGRHVEHVKHEQIPLFSDPLSPKPIVIDDPVTPTVAPTAISTDPPVVTVG